MVMARRIVGAESVANATATRREIRSDRIIAASGFFHRARAGREAPVRWQTSWGAPYYRYHPQFSGSSTPRRNLTMSQLPRRLRHAPLLAAFCMSALVPGSLLAQRFGG